MHADRDETSPDEAARALVEDTRGAAVGSRADDRRGPHPPAIEQGDPRAAHQLLPLVYDELRKLAA